MDKTRIKGKIFELTRDTNGSGRIDLDDLEWHYLEGDGDFRSPEVCALRDQADVIVTNPPFSLFREFLAWIMEAKKEFLIIGGMNAISYKEVFPLIKENLIWLGTCSNVTMEFSIPMGYEKWDRIENGRKYGKVPAITWFTNLEHGRRHTPLLLMSMQDNIRYGKHSEIKERGYIKYENYEAIDVPYTDAIPDDYDGIMGVPISFLGKYCPEQFIIIGHPHGDYGCELGLKPFPRKLKVLNKGLRDGDLYYLDENGKPELPYRRILIRKY
jgi:hypothetical protein